MYSGRNHNVKLKNIYIKNQEKTMRGCCQANIQSYKDLNNSLITWFLRHHMFFYSLANYNTGHTIGLPSGFLHSYDDEIFLANT